MIPPAINMAPHRRTMRGLLAAADVRRPSISNPAVPTRLGTAPSAPTVMSPTAAIMPIRPDGVSRDSTDGLGSSGRGHRRKLHSAGQPGNAPVSNGLARRISEPFETERRHPSRIVEALAPTESRNGFILSYDED